MAKRHEDLIAKLRAAKPFDPFRIVVTDGRKHLVLNPDEIIERGNEYVIVSNSLVRIPKNEIRAIQELVPFITLNES